MLNSWVSTSSARNDSASRVFRSGRIACGTTMPRVCHDLCCCRVINCRRYSQRIYTDMCGVHVRSGRRQSMPSSSIDSCARLNETVPPLACGQINLPFSSRFENRQSPSPSNHSNLIKSPRRPRNTNTCPENGACSNLVCTKALSPSKPHRISVTPAAIQICVLLGGVIIVADTPTGHATAPDRRYLLCSLAHDSVGCESCPPRMMALHRAHKVEFSTP